MGGPRRHGGDGGETGLAGGQRVRKDDLRIECIGSIDELSSFLGLAIGALAGREPEAALMLASLRRIQRELYLLGADLARPDDPGARLGADAVVALEREVEETEGRLPPLRAFLLPGGGTIAAGLHVARAVCRRAERQMVRLAARESIGAVALPYLNRLSLLLFALARQSAHQFGPGDELA